MTSSPLRHCRRCRLLGLFRTHLHESVVGEPHQQPQPPRNHGQMYFCHPMNFYFFTSLRKQQFLLVHWALRQEKRLRLMLSDRNSKQMRVKAVGNLVMSSNWSVGSYIVLAVVYEWQTNEIKTAKVKCKRNKYITKQSILAECILL